MSTWSEASERALAALAGTACPDCGSPLAFCEPLASLSLFLRLTHGAEDTVRVPWQEIARYLHDGTLASICERGEAFKHLSGGSAVDLLA